MRTRAHFPKHVRDRAVKDGMYMVCITVIGPTGKRRCEVASIASVEFARKAYQLAAEGTREALGHDPAHDGVPQVMVTPLDVAGGQPKPGQGAGEATLQGSGIISLEHGIK